MENIKIKSLGPIKEADITFGDLTFFVGPQASGKSIVLQLIKLLTDKTSIETNLENYGFVWGTDLDNNLERFFGEGMSGVWSEQTVVDFDNNRYTKEFLSVDKKARVQSPGSERLFYVPAQRVLCLNFGWPRFFKDFDDSVPYVLRDFSETMRQYLDSSLTRGEAPIFPKKWVTYNGQHRAFSDPVFQGGEITVDRTSRKRLKLKIDNQNLPFMTWSTGQKEYMPMLLAFYWLCQTKPLDKKRGVNYVVIEEPEMGLHPEAIMPLILQIMDLVARGFQVIVSTHSPIFLEFAWAFSILKKENAPATAFDALFDNDGRNKSNSFFDDDLINTNIKTYYFARVHKNVIVKDISSLDSGNPDLAVADWGGLSSFASKAADIISNTVANNI